MQKTVQTVVHRVQQCPPTRPKRRSIQPPRPGGHWNPVCWCTSIEAIACDRGWAYARTSRRFVTSWWAAGTSRLWPIVSSSRQRSRRSAAGAGKCFAGGRRHRRGGWPCPVCMTRVCLPGLIKLRRCLECSLKSRPLCREFRGRRQVSCVRERRPAHAVSLCPLLKGGTIALMLVATPETIFRLGSFHVCFYAVISSTRIRREFLSVHCVPRGREVNLITREGWITWYDREEKLGSEM